MSSCGVSRAKVLVSRQQGIDHGLNVFGGDLLAESFARDREKWAGGVCLMCYGKDGKPVFITITSETPEVEA
jgi:hypothetical protein